MRLRERLGSRGSTLLEVALAVALLPTSGMGLVATQLALSRQRQSSAVRGQAAFIADALAETAAEGAVGVGAREQWKTRTPVLIPGSVVTVDAVGASVSRSTVNWPAKSYGPASTGAAASLQCAGTSASSGRECVSLVFVQ